MENFKLVRPEHLNHYGYLFGGNLLKWVDEVAWIAASRDYPRCEFVTISLAEVEFHKSVRQGTILRFKVEQARLGKTSVRYRVDVFADDIDSGEESSIFTTEVSFVCLDKSGSKQPVLP